MLHYYTGFPDYRVFLAFFIFLGPAEELLFYSQKAADIPKAVSASGISVGRNRVLQPIDELLLVLMRLRLGLFEQDLSYHFTVLQSTVSRVWTTWVNFLHHKLKELTIWMTKDVVQATFPTIFRTDYPTTRVIIDATEVYTEMPGLPEIQQLPFSHYKNHNTYKGWAG